MAWLRAISGGNREAGDGMSRGGAPPSVGRPTAALTARRTGRRVRRWMLVALVPVTAAAALLVPAAAGNATAATTGPAAAAAAPARAAASQVVMLSTSVNGSATRALQPFTYVDGHLVPLAAPSWWDYNTFVPKSRISEDIDYDFSARMAGDMEKISLTITKVSAYINALVKLIQVITGHATAEDIASLVASILAIVGMSLKKWRDIVKKYTKKGKHTKNGFWSATFEDIFNQTYESSSFRSCTAKTIKCGSPGFWHLKPIAS